MSLKLKDLSPYLNFAKKLINVSERIIKKTPSNRLKIDFKSDKSLSFKGIYKIYRKKALLLIIFNLSYF